MIDKKEEKMLPFTILTYSKTGICNKIHILSEFDVSHIYGELNLEFEHKDFYRNNKNALMINTEYLSMIKVVENHI